MSPTTVLAPATDTACAGPDRSPGRRILLLGTHGQANIGDELLLDTFVDQLGHEHQYSVNSYDPPATRAQLEDRVDVTVFDTAGSRVELLRRLRASEVVVFAGGTIVKELYRSTGRWRHSTLCMVLAVVAMARLLGRPVLLANIGVGPLPTRLGRLLAGAIVHLATLVSVRDEGSYDLCRRLRCPATKVRLAPDAVWANDADTLIGSGADDAPELARIGLRPLRIGLNLNKDVEAADDWEVFLDRLVEALEIVGRAGPVELHALPMQSRFKDGTDLEVLDEVLDRLDLPAVVHTPATASDAAAIIEGCDVVVAERLHALVITAILGRPAVALPYDVKVRELVDQLGLGDRSFPADADLAPFALASAILAAGHGQADGARLQAEAAVKRAAARAHAADVRAWLDRPMSRWPRTGPA